MPSLGQP